ncbi:MAG TPA: response regulator [Williamwhitmania sp.]|nr:response regulator [Williamwhitmania sp.]
MLTAVIIDDEQNAISVLSQLLKDFTNTPVKVLGSAHNLDEGIKLINSTKPELVFLDIDMPNKSGLEIYDYFKEPQFRVIFVTAHSQYAIEALKNSATDYLLKPINFLELREALQKVAHEIEDEQQQRELEDRINVLTTAEMPGVNVVLDVENGFIMESTKNIEYCYADQSYAVIVTNLGKKITVTKTLKSMQEVLPAMHFYRTHKSYLVNIFYIRKFVKANESYVLLKSGMKVPVSVRNSTIITNDIKKMLAH